MWQYIFFSLCIPYYTFFLGVPVLQKKKRIVHLTLVGTRQNNVVYFPNFPTSSTSYSRFYSDDFYNDDFLQWRLYNDDFYSDDFYNDDFLQWRFFTTMIVYNDDFYNDDF